MSQRGKPVLILSLLVPLLFLSAYGRGGKGMGSGMENQRPDKAHRQNNMSQTRVFKDHELVVFERLDLSDEQREKFQTILEMHHKQRTELLKQERQLLGDVFDREGFDFDRYKMQRQKIGMELIENKALTILNLYSFLEVEQQDEYRVKLRELVVPGKRE